MMGKHKKFLVLATKNAGKNTVQHSIVNYIHRMHEETLVIPSIEAIKLDKMKTNKKINQLKKMCQDHKSYVVSIQHNGGAKVSVSEYIEDFAGWFDCVLDLRFHEEHRILCAVYEGRNTLKCVYQHELLKNFKIPA